MKRLLLTGCNMAQAELMDLTGPRMLTYANLHDIDFKMVRNYDPEIDPMWNKIPLILHELATYDQVIWIDADMMVTNLGRIPWYEMDRGLNMSRDWGPDATHDGIFTTACMIVHRDAAFLFQLAMANQEQWHRAEFHEMAYLRSIYGEHEKHFHVHPRRVLNAVHPDVCPDVIEPWEPGDWLCHATMVPVEERMRILKSVIQ